MEKSRKLLAITLSALCCVLLVLCVVFATGWSKASKIKADSPEVRNNGTAIQWKYASESEWHDLVTLDELKGAAGEKGADGRDGVSGKDGKDGLYGKNGVDGKDGADGKDGKNGKNGADGRSIEIKKTDSHIQWRYEYGSWQNLVALSDITGPSGQKGADGKDGKSPEFRVNENTLQWRYAGDEVWLNLYDLSSLRGSNGKTPFIGENGNWWIGETDTGVKAAGTDGIKGEKGDQGEKGEKGDKGDTGAQGEKGDAGQNGACSGYFYAETRIPRVFLNDGNAALSVYEKVNSGDLISTYLDKITLKKGHVYSVTISGSLQVVSNESNNSGNYSIQMTDGYNNDLCREVTRIKRDGEKIAQTNDQHSFNFTRIYDASDEDITLKFMFEQSAYNTRLESFKGTITITALN